MGFMDRLLRTGEGKKVRALADLVPDIGALEPEMQALSDEDLQHRTVEFREQLDRGIPLDDLLIPAFAVVREAASRIIGQRHYDVQLMGGAALHFGWVAEMKTGEGKTLVSTLPVYLNGLPGTGVHVITVNDYLARRDAEWMGQVHRFLGLTIGMILPGEQDPNFKREQYACDITYGTNNEFGFDYLRDNMALSLEEKVQRGHVYAIVDEVDSILIDEARTPLIISGRVGDAAKLYYKFASVARGLTRDVDYEVDEEKRVVFPLPDGIAKVEKSLGVENLYDDVSNSLVHQLQVSIKAKELYKRDRDYLVQNGEVKIVDEFTGRVLEGRRWSEGLHQAVEAKEGVKIKEENQTLATVTLQNYFRMYDKLAGMTGTALTEAAEFMSTYNLQVVPIPTHRPVQRRDDADLIYRSEAAKFSAVVDDIVERQAEGQPVLVGTVSVEKSERLSRELEKRGVPHSVLNAKQHTKEAEVVTQAGRIGSVTVATNMAGRGVDILLGGNPEGLARREVHAEGLEDGTEEAEARFEELLAKYEVECKAEGEEVRKIGGLYVLGTERHESRRIDNQLRGRSGRQGDPGRSKFYLSLEDDLMRIFAPTRMDGMLQRLGLKDGEAIVHPWVTKALEKAQQKVEARNFDIRKNLLKFDNVMNDQRKVIYEQRKELMQASDLSDEIKGMREEVIGDLIARYIPEKAYAEQWDTTGLHEEVMRIFGLNLPLADWAKEEGIADEAIRERVTDAVDRKMAEKAARIGPEIMRVAEKTLLLQILDQSWKEHLLGLDHLRHGIGLRAYGQRDPLNEYKKEAFEMFEALLVRLREQITMLLSHIEIRQPEPVQAPQPQVEPARAAAMAGAGAAASGGDPANWQNVNRNAPCPCGSGKKFKHCHGKLS